MIVRRGSFSRPAHAEQDHRVASAYPPARRDEGRGQGVRGEVEPASPPNGRPGGSMSSSDLPPVPGGPGLESRDHPAGQLAAHSRKHKAHHRYEPPRSPRSRPSRRCRTTSTRPNPSPPSARIWMMTQRPNGAREDPEENKKRDPASLPASAAAEARPLERLSRHPRLPRFVVSTTLPHGAYGARSMARVGYARSLEAFLGVPVLAPHQEGTDDEERYESHSHEGHRTVVPDDESRPEGRP